MFSVSIIPSVLWKSDLESNPYLYNASNNGITMTESDMLQSIEDARKAFIATQGVKISSIFICKMAVQVVTDMFVGPLIHRIGCMVPMFAGNVVMSLSAIGRFCSTTVYIVQVSEVISRTFHFYNNHVQSGEYKAKLC